MYSNFMNTPREVIGYVRVSTEEQGATGLGLDDQRQTIALEAERRGWSVRFIADEGHSAGSLSRPGISRALEDLRTGRARTLVVAKLDRLSRSLLDFATIMRDAQKQGWELVVLDLAIDTSVPSGALMANVMASFAEYERALISHRTKAALAQLKRRGVRLGRPRQTEDAVLDRIASDRSSGMSLRQIADGLTRDGVATTRGGKWHASTVSAALRSLELDREAA